MLRRLYRCAVRLHPSSFRRRFGEEMLYIFDQQTGRLAALGVMLDCILSLLRQWTLRRHIGTELPASPLRNPTADHIPSFESLDAFQPRASAIIPGALLSLILFYMTVLAIPYSWIHVLHLRIEEIGVNSSQQLSTQTHLQVDVIPTESANPLSKASPRTALAPVPRRIWLDRYVGEYISNDPPAEISVQIEEDPFRGNHLSISLAGKGHPGLALSPVSPTKFTISGVENSYVDFTADVQDVQGRICCLSWVVNGNATRARRQY